ncbi:hypothetical protein BKA69DRAFT_1085969 [Paraphysoderma sedebokerense]|nr:hypothetical protein BKA69DRAFT_1085969 [Paraphysoderma sedebokerense]
MYIWARVENVLPPRRLGPFDLPKGGTIGDLRAEIEFDLREIQEELGWEDISNFRIMVKGRWIVDDDLKCFVAGLVNRDTVQVFPPAKSVEKFECSPDIEIDPKSTSESTKSQTLSVKSEEQAVSNQAKSSSQTHTEEELNEIKNALGGEDVELAEYVCSTCQGNSRKKKCSECGCGVCKLKSTPDPSKTIECDECLYWFHWDCLEPALTELPKNHWYCPSCKNADNTVKAADKDVTNNTKKGQSKGALRVDKKWGGGDSCNGVEKVVVVPSNHIGKIPGIRAGQIFRNRNAVSAWAVHGPLVAGMSGGADGCYSVVISGGYEGDDQGEEFIYTGSGGRDYTGNKRQCKGQTKDQELTRANLGLAKTIKGIPINKKEGAGAKDWKTSNPIRVLRKGSSKSKFFKMEKCYRYDGIYKLVKYYPEKGQDGYILWRYVFRRDDDEPAPWTEEGKKYVQLNGMTMIDPDRELRRLARARKERKGVKLVGSQSLTSSTSSKKRKRSKVEDDDENSDLDDFQDSANSENVSPLMNWTPQPQILGVINADIINQKPWGEILSQQFTSEAHFIEVVSATFQCSVCLDAAWILCHPQKCKHFFCLSCKDHFLKSGTDKCPCCRMEIDHTTGDNAICLNEEFIEIVRLLNPVEFAKARPVLEKEREKQRKLAAKMKGKDGKVKSSNGRTGALMSHN